MANDVVGVVVNVSVEPGEVDEFVALAVRTMIEPTQTVPGCIRYELWQDREEPERFAIIEEWESEEAHAAHLGSDWLQPVIAALQPFASAPFDMQRLRKAG
jgi:quinol monooxygenase YgiN